VFGYTREPVNTGAAIKMYANVAPCGTPFVDINADGDVDQSDFGVFQACFTGTGFGGTLTFPCKCFDRTGATPGVPDGSIDALDYNYFMSCWSGPKVPWVASAGCPE